MNDYLIYNFKKIKFLMRHYLKNPYFYQVPPLPLYKYAHSFGNKIDDISSKINQNLPGPGKYNIQQAFDSISNTNRSIKISPDRKKALIIKQNNSDLTCQSYSIEETSFKSSKNQNKNAD